MKEFILNINFNYSKVLIKKHCQNAIYEFTQEQFCVAINYNSIMLRIYVPVEFQERVGQLFPLFIWLKKLKKRYPGKIVKLN